MDVNSVVWETCRLYPLADKAGERLAHDTSRQAIPAELFPSDRVPFREGRVRKRNVARGTILAQAFFIVLTISAAHAQSPSILPTVPGATNPAVTQANISATICKANWTAKIRPPASYTNKFKAQQLHALGYADQNPRHYEEDHLISLEIGGSPTDPKNLWPEAYAGIWGARTKDKLEDFLHRQVCAHKMTLQQAQTEIATDWVSAYRKYLGEP